MNKETDGELHPFRETARNRKAKRDSIDSIRTRYWYEAVELKTGLPSAYAMERRFEPEAFGQKGSTRYHRNKWASYRSGKRTPRAALIEKVEREVPGTARLINHVLWRALRVADEVLPHVGSWLNELDPYIQRLVYEKAEVAAVSSRRRRRRVDARLIGILGRHASLDALACLTMLLREAWESGNSAGAFEAVVPTLRIVIAHSCSIPMFNVAEELFEIYRRDILSPVIHNSMKYDFEGYSFGRSVEIVHGILLRWEDQGGPIYSWNEALKKRLDIQSGRYGFEISMLLRPKTVKAE